MCMNISDITEKANNGIDTTIYFSHHSLQRIQQRIEWQASETRSVAEIADVVASALLKSCYYIDGVVYFNEVFRFLLGNEVYVCQYGDGEIFIRTAFIVNSKERIERLSAWKRRGIKVVESWRSVNCVEE